ncbi:hypothetical protein DRN67_01070, partial [Candidatus Micrarchaeota archaeon]
ASGIDARTVIAGKPQIFMKRFNPLRYDVTDAGLSLPKGTSLIVIDTYRGKRQSTGQLTAHFAEVHGIKVKPWELGEEERVKLLAPYAKIFKGMVAELKAEGNAKKLGKLMNANQKLLGCVSSKGIKRAVAAARKAGAYGAKLTGAGGEGGAVITLVPKKKVRKIVNACKKLGFRAFEAL